MTAPEPIYTAENCRASYRLTWSVSLFWRAPAGGEGWLGDLAAATEADGVRIVRHRLAGARVSQFLVSTTPGIAPGSAIRCVKGRLQRLLRGQRPKAFRRNYSIQSVGSARSRVVEEYVSGQLDHHRMADPEAQRLLRRFQIRQEEVDLSRLRRSAHGQFVCNLHVVLVHDGRWMAVREDVLEATRRTLLKVSRKKGHLLSRAGVFADHLHLALGCGITESPSDVALAYMNNLAYAQGMRPVYQFGYYAGTFGEYDYGALRE